MSQGLEALLGSLFLCDSALHATNPPSPAMLKTNATNKTTIQLTNCND